ncbi:MAG: MBL fold metallo-hydrolase, partial [Anaerolineales bacterium]
LEVKPRIFFQDAPGVSSNIFFIKTDEGVVWIDTGMTVADVQAVVEEAGHSQDEITLLINTHADIDPIGGNSFFSAPKLAHEKTLQRMRKAGRPEEELPTQTFNGDSTCLNIGGFQIELVYMGGHKIDQTIVWLPEQKVLIPSDLVFQGRYPFMMGSDVPKWADALKKLPDFEPEVILPGHGTMVSWDDINLQLAYMETTWQMVEEMLHQGVSTEEMFKNPKLPRVDTWDKQDFFERNIVEIVEQIKRRDNAAM